MRRLVLVFFVILFALISSLTIAQETTVPTPEDFLVNPDTYSGDLPSRLVSTRALTFETPLGTLRTNFLDNLQRLFLQYNDDPFQYFNVPPEWGFGAEGTIEVFPFPDGTQVLYCNHAVRAEAPVRTTGVGIIIAPQTGNVRRVETCYVTPNANGYVFSEELVSPDGSQTVVISPTRDLDETACPPLEYITSFGYPSQIFVHQKAVACLNAPGIEGRGWVGEDKLTLRAFDPKDSLPVERWYQLNTTTEELIPLGLTMEFQDSLIFSAGQSAFMLDDGQTLIRWMVDAMAETTRHPAGVLPDTCRLEILNLATLNASYVHPAEEAASCLFYPEIAMTPAQDTLIYVYTAPNPDDVALPTSTVRRVDLATTTETVLSATGRAVHIRSLSPDGRYALLIVDAGEEARNDPFENGIAYDDPRWVIYDLNADTAVYTSPALAESYTGYLQTTVLGFQAFEWTTDGWLGVFNDGDIAQPVRLMRWSESTGELTEILLDGLPPRTAESRNYFVGVSPDHAYLSVMMGTEMPVYLVETATGRVEPLTVDYRDLLGATMRVSTGWLPDGDYEVSLYDQNNLLSLARWRISPSKAFMP